MFQAQDLTGVVEALLSSLDEIGFADPDEEVNGGDCVDVINQHLSELRKAVRNANAGGNSLLGEARKEIERVTKLDVVGRDVSPAWQRKLSPNDMVKVIDLLITHGESMEDEFPSGNLLHQDFCEELASLITNCCGGMLVEVDEARNFIIQADSVMPEVEGSIWRFAGENLATENFVRPSLGRAIRLRDRLCAIP